VFLPNLKSVASAVPDTVTIGVLGGVANPKFGEDEAIGGPECYCLKERW